MKTVSCLFIATFFVTTLTTPSLAVEPFRLDRISIVQYTTLPSGLVRESQGVLYIEGNIVWRSQTEVDRPAGLLDWAFGRPLIQRETWTAYYTLGPGVLANFKLDTNVGTLTINGSEFRPVFVATNAGRLRGRMVNISTRARINVGDTPVIAGFVIEGYARTVLVRGIGPTLATLGVTDAAPDPVLRIYRKNEVVFFNDNWGIHWGAETTRLTSERVGAFTLPEDSRDAAVVLTLEPGVYTVHVEPAATSTSGGTILVEVYEVPLD